ncbi:MAG: polyprenyl diphosphate synthase [Patescibacteria group bacterium]
MNDKKIPNHLGIILDGNRRWAKERHLPAIFGHRKGAEVVKKIINLVREKGVKILTLFVFSTENWKRSQKEVDYLMGLLKRAFLNKGYIKDIHDKGIKVKIIGERDKFTNAFREKIKQIEELTKDNKSMILNFALSYGGRAEIVHAIKNIIEKKIPIEKINEETIKENLWISEVDLIIRTGKAQRISNFLVWQAAYSELYFSPKYWPDFSENDLELAFAEYARCQRRFGR